MNAPIRRSLQAWPADAAEAACAAPGLEARNAPDLPPEAPLAMPAQAFWDKAQGFWGKALPGDHAWRALALVLGTLAMTVPAVACLYGSLRLDGLGVIDLALLAVFALLFAWIAMAFLSALAGFALGERWDGEPCLDPSHARPSLASRTAVLSPIYNETPQALFARLRAMAESLETANATQHFDVFVLSDTTQPRIQAQEYAVFLRLRERLGGRIRLYYRHRAENIDRKAGNIAEWVTRFGGAYDHMVILDADSLMSADTLVRLAGAMERDPTLGLLQTTPVLVNRSSLLARAQQFACRLYGPMLSRGIAWWSGDQGNYWGHNAIIRVSAFASCAGLPHLPGKKPMGGHILSHDFVEAALLRRAGWAVRMAPLLGGSFEETPPTLTDMVARDRRWCQGNLQHLMIMPARGLHWISRFHLLRGVSSYLTSPLWLAFLLLGLGLSLDPHMGAAVHAPVSVLVLNHASGTMTDLFLISMALLMAPKVMAFWTVAASPLERRRFGGGQNLFVSLLAETVLSTLLAPVMMFNQVRAMVSILAGRDSGWSAQTREEGRLSLAMAARFHGPDTAAGVVMGAAALLASPAVFWWMAPVIFGLVSAIPLAMLTARTDLGLAAYRAGLLLTPEELTPSRLILQADSVLDRMPDLRIDQRNAWNLPSSQPEPLFG